MDYAGHTQFHRAYPIDVTKLDQTIFAFREAVSRSTYDPQPLARQLYKMLFLQSDKGKTTLARDLETYLKGQKDKTLMWSLDGVLRYLPVAALQSKAEALQRAQIALLKGELKETAENLPGPRSSERVAQEMEGFNLTPYKTDPQRPFAHPYYWAPFVLIGNWR